MAGRIECHTVVAAANPARCRFDSRMRGVPHRPQPFRPRVLAGIEAVHGQARRAADVGGIAADDCPAADRNPTVCAQYVFEQQRVQRDAGQAGRRILEGGID